MIKTFASIEILKGERKYNLILENDSPLGECFDVLCEMKAEVLAVINKNEQVAKDAKEAIKIDVPVTDEVK